MRIPTLVVLGLFLAGCPKSSPAGTCTADDQCTAPGKCCGGKCVDLQTSASHCGACGTACGTQNGAARCAAGVCAISCTSGFGDCNATAKDGCETELTTSVNHCGTCATVCMSAHATSICERSQCLQSSCLAGFGDCNASATDGCEVDVKSTLNHCGACGKKCEIIEGVGACTQSQCTVATCNPGFGDCDSSAASGCETDLRITDAHCGVCGMACAAGYQCKVGKCVAPELLFYGGVISLQSSLATNVVSSFNVDTRAWSSVATSGVDPGNRFAHLAIWDTAGKQMLVWGGYLSNNLPTDNSLWALDYAGDGDGGTQPAWKKLVTTGTAPISRGFMGVAWNKVTRTLYVYGGTDADNNNVFDDLYELDVATLKWTRRTEGGGPTARYEAAMVWDSAKQRVLIGQGIDDNFLPTSDFYTFDPADGGAGWSPVVASGTPTARAASVFLGDVLPLHLYGGIDDFGAISTDLHRFDDLDGGAQWALLNPANPPTERGYPIGISTTERRFLFGGFAFLGGLTSYGDMWELEADAGWIRIADGGVNFVHPGTVFTTAVARE